MIEEKWCKVVEVDGQAVLFYKEYLVDEDRYCIHNIFHLEGIQMDMKVEKDNEFTEAQFLKGATAANARKLIAVGKDLIEKAKKES